MKLKGRRSASLYDCFLLAKENSNYLGLAFCIAYCFCIYFSIETIVPLDSIPLFWALFFLSGAVTSVVLVVVAQRFVVRMPFGAIVTLGICLIIGGLIFYHCNSFFGQGIALIFISAALIVLIARWWYYYAFLSLELRPFVICLALVAGVLVSILSYFFMALFPFSGSTLATMSALISLYFSFSSEKLDTDLTESLDNAKKDTSEADPKGIYDVIGKQLPIHCLYVAFFSVALMVVPFDSDINLYSYLLIFLVASFFVTVCLMFFYFFFKAQAFRGPVVRITFPLFALALCLIPFVGYVTVIPVIVLLACSFWCAFHSMLALFTRAAHDTHAFRFRAICITIASLSLASLIGAVAAYLLLRGNVFATEGTTVLLVAVALGVVAEMLGNYDIKVFEEDNQTIISPSNLSRFRHRCKELCSERGLSPRECDVFLLLAKGRSSTYIAKELFISATTVKTHIASIYRKFNVNSRQEFLDQLR